MFGLNNTRLRDVEVQLSKMTDDIARRDLKYYLKTIDKNDTANPLPDMEIHARNLLALVQKNDKNGSLHYAQQIIQHQESMSRRKAA